MSNTRFGYKYTLKIGRNQELIQRIRPALPVPYDPSVKGDDFFDVLTDYTYHQTAVLAQNPYLKVPNASPFSTTLHNDITAIPPKSMTITDLHIDVDIKDGNENREKESGGVSDIRIYNMKKESREFIRPGDAVILHAGWLQDGDNLPQLYVGQVETVTHKNSESRTDIITHIRAKQAKLIDNVRINRSYPKETKLRDVIKDILDIAASKGIPTGAFFENNSHYSVLDRTYPFGHNVSGTLLGALEEVCSNNGYKARMVKGRLYVQPVGFRDFVKTVTVTPADVVGSVHVQDDAQGTDIRGSGGSKPRQIRFKIRLNARVDTATVLKMDSETVQGTYKVDSIHTKLTYEGKSWEMTITASEVK